MSGMCIFLAPVPLLMSSCRDYLWGVLLPDDLPRKALQPVQDEVVHVVLERQPAILQQ